MLQMNSSASFAEPREQKTESSDNSPEQMRLSPIWSIIALTNKWHAVWVWSTIGKAEGKKAGPGEDIHSTSAQHMKLSLVHPHKNLAR